jgi:hypothetical protein
MTKGKSHMEKEIERAYLYFGIRWGKIFMRGHWGSCQVQDSFRTRDIRAGFHWCPRARETGDMRKELSYSPAYH